MDYRLTTMRFYVDLIHGVRSIREKPKHPSSSRGIEKAGHSRPGAIANPASRHQGAASHPTRVARRGEWSHRRTQGGPLSGRATQTTRRRAAAELQSHPSKSFGGSLPTAAQAREARFGDSP